MGEPHLYVVAELVDQFDGHPFQGRNSIGIVFSVG